MFRITFALSLAWTLAVVSGCGTGSAASSSSTTSPRSVSPNPAYLLTEAPADASSVAEVRREGQDGDEVVVVGWVAGSMEPIIPGRAAFTIVDMQLPVQACAPKPYSYCCMSKEDLLPNMVMVKFVDDDGRTILQDARELLGIREGSVVVIHGHVQCGEDGTVNSVVASGLFDAGYSENPSRLAGLTTSLPGSR